ncbi:MAG: PIN domain-containing protein [Planctomycetes bacterium]|nr:PIN domain-containing protein [Planctomycetota bacterium]
MVPILVFDTNVLVAAFRSRTGASNALVRRVGTGRFDTALTTPLLLEYEDVLMRSPDDLGLTPSDVTDLLDYLCRVCALADVRFRVRPSVPDPGDELVLEAAVASGAAWIVTHNVRDLAAGSARFGVEVVRPGEALRRLGVSQ